MRSTKVARLPPAPVPPLSHLAVRLPAGGRFQTMLLLAVPVVAMGLASSGFARWLSVTFAGLWMVLVLLAVWNRWITLVLPVLAAGFFGLTVVVLPFNSPASIVNYWTAVALMYLSIPEGGG